MAKQHFEGVPDSYAETALYFKPHPDQYKDGFVEFPIHTGPPELKPKKLFDLDKLIKDAYFGNHTMYQQQLHLQELVSKGLMSVEQAQKALGVAPDPILIK